ncbi:MAG: hypothetical protein GX890_02265 [Firmicutes bacterium]|jgi:hypothetical protein|nr:hypothetical protein [Bacillota bacterium]HPU01226.1 hypothetical protein [Bacillota bacterium]
MASGEKIPAQLYRYFWDVFPEEIDLQKHRVFVIERLLNEGDHHALAWLFENYSQSEIKEAVIASQGLSLKTARCWQNFFDLKEEEICSAGKRSAVKGKLF